MHASRSLLPARSGARERAKDGTTPETLKMLR
jgi:hypothetical protein